MPSVFSASTAIAQRLRLQETIEARWSLLFDQFLRGVIDDASAAVAAPVLLAAGRRYADPFAFTNVLARWRSAIRQMATMDGLDEDNVRSLLEESSIPGDLFAEVAGVIRDARSRGLTETGTKRKLSALLIPGQGDIEDRGAYRNRIRYLAQSVSTQAYNRLALMTLAAEGVPGKRWVSRHDEAVRHAHAAVDGTVVPIYSRFRVGGFAMDAPGDPTAPLDLVINCRCVLVGARADELTSSITASGGEKTMPEILTKPATELPAPDIAKAATDCGCPNTLTAAGEPAANLVPWEGPVVMEGVLTGDGRLIEKGALRWDDLPIPFRYVESDVGGHAGAYSTGTINTLERKSNGEIWGTGFVDLDAEKGLDAARKMGTEEEPGNQPGISVDMDDMTFEVRIASEILTGPEEEGPVSTEETPMETDEDGRVTVMKISPSDEVMVVTDARIRAATQVSIPAFAGARGHLLEALELEDAPAPSLVAAGFPKAPSASLFTDPKLTEPTPLTVTKDGRVFGHLATWDSCHISYSAMGDCVTAPHSATDYAHFHTGALETAEGRDVAVGKIIVDTTHAGDKLRAKAAYEHYDHSGAAAAFVRAGEDRHGIWIAGIVSPDATPKQIRSMKSSPLSGDWRRVKGAAMELVAALAVNVPGFSIPRPRALVASGAVQTMTAVGMLAPKRVPAATSPEALSEGDLRYLKALAGRERERAEVRVREQAAKSLARRVAATRKTVPADGRA